MFRSSYSRDMSKDHNRGFTIIELLIVIVVIAVLAVLSIVAFNGVQARASNSQTISALGTYVKALQAYAIDNGSYPIEAAYPCLGTASTACGITNPTAPGCWGVGYVTGNATLSAAILTEVSKVPELSTQKMTCNGASQATGAFYHSSADGKTASIYYFLRGDTDCGSPAGVPAFGRAQAADTTYCGITLSTT